MKSGISQPEVDEMLEEMLADDTKSEALFDAYRSVCFSKSKDLGPKIIGILTARLIVEGRSANLSEEIVFKTAETFSDTDLIELNSVYEDQISKVGIELTSKAKMPQWYHGSLIVPWNEEYTDSNWNMRQKEGINISPLDFNEALGSWGSNAALLGLVSSKMSHRTEEYEEDSERHVDTPGTLTFYSWTLTFESPCELLRELLKRALNLAE